MKKKVIQVCGGFHFSLVLVDSGHVYSMGYNLYGQLGLGDTNTRYLPCMINEKYFNHEKIIHICAGLDNAIALSRNGNVYTWGKSKKSHGLINIDRYPKKIDSFHFNNEHIRYINAAINYFHFAISKNNNIYSWGNNSRGQLAIGDNHEYQLNPIKVDSNTYNNEKIIKVCCGFCFTALLTQKGNIYLCGLNYFKKLGFCHDEPITTFQQMQPYVFKNQKIKDIAVNDTMFAITENNDFYTWEHIMSPISTCFDNTNTQHMKEPKFVDPSYFGGEKVQRVSCGMYCVFAVTSSKKIYAWGDNKKGQLAMKHFNHVDCPCVMDSAQFGSEDVICLKSSLGDSLSNNYGHSFAITKKGCLFVWGDNSVGQLGLGRHLKKCFNQPQLCFPDLFGSDGLKNDKMYNNKSFKDVLIDFS